LPGGTRIENAIKESSSSNWPLEQRPRQYWHPITAPQRSRGIRSAQLRASEHVVITTRNSGDGQAHSRQSCTPVGRS